MRYSFVVLALGLVACATAGPEAEGGPDGPKSDNPIDAPSTPGDGPITPVDAPVPPIDAPPAAIDAGIDAPPSSGPPDTCGQAQDLTAGAMQAGGITVTGNTTGYADDIQTTSACTGFLPDGPDAIYVVNVPAGRTLTAVATPTTSWDISLELVMPCTLTPTCLAGRDSALDGGAETASYTAAAATTVHVVVDGYNPDVEGPYTLNVRVQ
ncbi:MAG TPA: hypothetical protein VM734_24840 [Kofleriaceae bacterium]|nr:hypothetical protein [Kofleriaceae bacterium]